MRTRDKTVSARKNRVRLHHIFLVGNSTIPKLNQHGDSRILIQEDRLVCEEVEEVTSSEKFVPVKTLTFAGVAPSAAESKPSISLSSHI